MPHANMLRSRLLVAVFSLFMATSFVGGTDPPDVKTNPVSGFNEVTDAFLDGSAYQVRHVIRPDPSQAPQVAVLTNSAGNLGPRIDIKSSGETWIVWWRDSATDEVVYRVRNYQTGSWTAEARISTRDESSRHPEIVHDGSTTWVAYEADVTSGTAVAVAATGDSAEPFPTATIVATTGFTGDVDVLAHSESGHVWVTWVHSATNVGWSEYNKTAQVWGTVGYQSYASSTIQAARDLIRATVLVE